MKSSQNTVLNSPLILSFVSRHGPNMLILRAPIGAVSRIDKTDIVSTYKTKQIAKKKHIEMPKGIIKCYISSSCASTNA